MALEIGLLEQILAELKKLNANLEQVQPPQYGINTARLISLAKTGPQAAIAEAKRLSRIDTARRREEKKRRKQTKAGKD